MNEQSHDRSITDPEQLLASGVELVRVGRGQEAIPLFQRATRLAPQDYRAPYNLGQLYLQRGLTHEAAIAFHTAAQRSPRNIEVLVDLAIAQRQTQALTAALATLHRALSLRQKHPLPPRAYLCLGLIYAAQGKLSAGIKVFKQVISRQPEQIKAHLHLGLLLCKAKRDAEALDALQRAVTLGASSPEAQAQIGTILLRQNKHEQAIKHLSRAAEQLKNDGEIQLNLGLALEKSQRLEQAKQAYGRAVQLLPHSAEANLRLALLLLRDQETHLAQKHALQALRLDQKMRQAIDPIISALVAKKELDEALQLVEAILTYFPRDKLALHNKKVLVQMKEKR